MRNVSDASCGENQSTHFRVNKGFYIDNRAVYEIMKKNTAVARRLQTTIWRMRVAWWIPTATNTQSE